MAVEAAAAAAKTAAAGSSHPAELGPKAVPAE
jgi:hypothetical protein